MQPGISLGFAFQPHVSLDQSLNVAPLMKSPHFQSEEGEPDSF